MESKLFFAKVIPVTQFDEHMQFVQRLEGENRYGSFYSQTTKYFGDFVNGYLRLHGIARQFPQGHVDHIGIVHLQAGIDHAFLRFNIFPGAEPPEEIFAYSYIGDDATFSPVRGDAVNRGFTEVRQLKERDLDRLVNHETGVLDPQIFSGGAVGFIVYYDIISEGTDIPEKLLDALTNGV
jgi:hypothetical protein